MPVTRAQSKVKNSGTSTVTIGSGDGWVAPTAGRRLVAFVGGGRTADTIDITSQAWTPLQKDSISSGQQQGLASFIRTADGSETSITAVIGGAGTTFALCVLEYVSLAAFGLGVGPIDYPALSRDGGNTQQASWAADMGTLVETRSADEVWLAAVCASGNILTPSASDGFTVIHTGNRLMVAELIVSARGDAHTVLSWTTSGSTRMMSQFMALAADQLPPHFVGWGVSL